VGVLNKVERVLAGQQKKREERKRKQAASGSFTWNREEEKER
jgi:hypothetical protein